MRVALWIAAAVVAVVVGAWVAIVAVFAGRQSDAEIERPHATVDRSKLSLVGGDEAPADVWRGLWRDARIDMPDGYLVGESGPELWPDLYQ